jgi:hypothetical protein
MRGGNLCDVGVYRGPSPQPSPRTRGGRIISYQHPDHDTTEWRPSHE